MTGLAVVTGASSGIGQAYAERLAADGWDLVVVARRHERLGELAERLAKGHDISVTVMPADLADLEQLSSIADDLATQPVDMLVNNAALAHYMPFAELPPDRATELVNLNVLAPVRLTRAAIPGMRERSHGTIVNVASLLAFSGAFEAPHMPKRAVYAASKSFLVTFTEILANELRDDHVRVQVVCPGVVRTEFHTRQDIDMSHLPRMEPHAVVEASLLGLERGEVVCIPGMVDATVTQRLAAVHQEFMGATMVTELPERYRQSE